MARATKRQFQALANRLSPKLRKAFLDSIQNIKDSVSIQELTKAVEAGDVERIISILGLNYNQFIPVQKAIRETVEAGAAFQIEALPKKFPKGHPRAGATLSVSFDGENPRVQKLIRDLSGDLIVQITDKQRDVIRELLDEGFQRGDNPRKVALDLVGRINKQTGKRVGGVVGLSDLEKGWLNGYRKKLEDAGKSPDEIARLMIKKEAKYLKVRGDRIARTETLKALNHGRIESTQQMIDAGTVTKEQVKKKWSDTGDDRTRDSHNQMDGQTVDFDKPFITPSGYSLMFPGDTSLGAPGKEVIQCRCYMQIVIDWLAGFRRSDPLPQAA